MKTMKYNYNYYSLVCLIIITIAAKSVNAGFCTLCLGTNKVPNTKANVTGQQTCLELAMTAVFYDDNDSYCNYIRDMAMVPCGCYKLNSEAPSKAPSSIPSPSPSIATTTSISPTLSLTVKPSTGPSTFMERIPDCDALRNGQYPDIPSTHSNVINFVYKAALYLDPNSSLDAVVSKLQDKSSRVVSAIAAGCDYDENNKNNARRHLRNLDATSTNKINFVQFSEMEEQPQESCSRNAVFVPSECIIVKGNVEINYSTKLDDETFLQSTQTSILNTMKVKRKDMYLNVDGVIDMNVLSLEPSLSSSNSTIHSSIPIGLGVGLSAAALLVGGCFVKKKGGGNLKKAFNPRKANIEYIPESDQNDNDPAERWTLYRLSEAMPTTGLKSYESMNKDKSKKKQQMPCTEEYYDICFPLRCLPIDSEVYSEDSHFNNHEKDIDITLDTYADDLSAQGIEIELIEGLSYNRTFKPTCGDTVEL